MPNQKHSNLRAIDANCNRASEALRVIEDYLRFVVGDEFLTSLCKHLRHDLGTLVKAPVFSDAIIMRDASGDVGRKNTVASEYERDNLVELALANFKRAQQSLRVLEEFTKVDPFNQVNGIDGESNSPSFLAGSFEKLRYRVYDLEKSVLNLADSCRRLGPAQLYVLLDAQSDLENFRATIQSMVTSGVDIIQLRDKSLDDRQLLTFAETLVEETCQTKTLSIINDRVDIAMVTRADGVHLGQEDMSIGQARQIVGPKMLIGVSAHNIGQARQAVVSGANYIGVGPTFPSTTKHFDGFKGVELLREVASEIQLPAFAIGGIDLENLDDVLQTGCQRIAVAGAIPNSIELIPAAVERFVLRLAESFVPHAQPMSAD